MTRDVCVATAEDTIEQAARLMVGLDIRVLPVSENDHLVGMITDRDIAVRAGAQGKGPATKVRGVMSGEVTFCFVDPQIDDVTHNMGDIKVRCLPVLDRDSRLVGTFARRRGGDFRKRRRGSCIQRDFPS